MSDYVPITNFTAKDALLTGDPNKLTVGATIDAELVAIAAAITSKYDTSDIATQLEATTGTSNSVLMTPLRVSELIAAGGGTSNPLTVGTGGTATDAGLILDAGATDGSDTPYILFQHASATKVALISAMSSSGATYGLNMYASDLTTKFIRLEDASGTRRVLSDVDWEVDGDLTVDGSNNLITRGGGILLNDDVTYPGVADWSFFATGATAYNRLVLRPPISGGPTGKSEFDVKVQSAGSNVRTFSFDQNGNFSSEADLRISSRDGTDSDSAALRIRNYDHSDQGDAWYTLFSTGAGSAETQLTIEPQGPGTTYYTGEVNIIVGDPDGTSYAWKFTSDGKLTRNGVQQLP